MPTARVTGDFPYEVVPDWHLGLARAGIRVHEFPDVAVDAAGRILLLAREPGMVVVVDSDGEVLSTFGEGVLSGRPHGISVGGDGVVYVVDQSTHQVQLFDSAGAHLGTIGSGEPSDTGVDLSLPVPGWTASITRLGEPFNMPTSAATTADGDLLVSDGYGNAALHRFDADRRLVTSLGGPGLAPGRFMLPHYVIVARDGRIVVADREADRLQYFDASGAHLRDVTTVRRPTAVAERPDGLLVVGELAWQKGALAHRRGVLTRGSPARISVIRPDGRVVGRLAAAPGLAVQGSVVAPHGLALDAEGSLYVAEVSATFTRLTQPFTIQKFAARW